MGALHPYEQALTLLLAFGPFVLLGVVVWLRAGRAVLGTMWARRRTTPRLPTSG